MKILAFAGFTNSGKSTAAKLVEQFYPNTFIRPSHINEPMVEMAIPLLRALGVPESEIMERLTGEMKEDPIPGWPDISGKKILQVIGHDLKHGIDPTGRIFAQLWIHKTYPLGTTNRRHILMESLRFPMEKPTYEEYGDVEVIDVWIEREGCEPHNGARYEQRLDTKYTIENNSTLTAFFDSISEIVESEGLHECPN